MGSKIINSLKLITFDATGTLLQFCKPPVEVYMEFALKHGIPTDGEKMKISFRKQWKELNSSQPHYGVCWTTWWTQFVVGTFKDSGVTNVNESILNSIATELLQHFRTSDCWEVKPGTVDLLSQLSQHKGLRVGVISNFDPRLREILKNVGISELLEFCILSHEEQISKPSKEIFMKALARGNLKLNNFEGISTAECLHIGDNYEFDFVGATSAGWKAALLIPPENLNDVVPNLPANSVFTSLPQFNNYLFSYTVN